MATIGQLLGKVSPLNNAENGKELLKKYKTWDQIPANEVKEKPIIQHKIVYDSTSETLEPIYFWILDFMNELKLSPEKLVDNFGSSPGSGHFGEIGQRMSVMQQQGTKVLADINTVLRSILNIIYDLKDFKQRLQQYEDIKSKDKNVSQAARLSLKQVWMDKVDMNKGNSAIKAMAAQAGFVTLLDAFLVAENEKDALEKLDLNDRIKRIVAARIQEFNVWVEQSAIELNKRYDIEKTYLKSQVNSLRIYAQWAKPYLKAAQELQAANMSKNPALVKIFNTVYMELTLLGKSKIDPTDAAMTHDFPLELAKNQKIMKTKRDYYGIVVIDFTFRGIPNRLPQQGFVYGGLAEFTIKAFSLNGDELKAFQKEVEEDLVGEVFKLVEGATTESLMNLRKEINYYLGEDLVLTEEEQKEKKKKEKTEKKKEGGFWDVFYPFGALFGKHGSLADIGTSEEGKMKKSEEKKKDDEKKSKPEDYIEKTFLRPLAKAKAKSLAFTIEDIYKKSHGMAAFPL